MVRAAKRGQACGRERRILYRWRAGPLEPPLEPPHRVPPAALSVTQRDKRGQLECFGKVELADLVCLELCHDEVAALECSAERRYEGGPGKSWLHSVCFIAHLSG